MKVDLEFAGVVIAAASALAATIGLVLNASKVNADAKEAHGAEHQWRARVDVKLDSIEEHVREIRDEGRKNASDIGDVKTRLTRVEMRVDHLRGTVNDLLEDAATKEENR